MLCKTLIGRTRGLVGRPGANSTFLAPDSSRLIGRSSIKGSLAPAARLVWISMPLFPRSPKAGEVPVFNSSCPWASTSRDLEALYASDHTAAITTRTATLHGFPDNPTLHQMVFFAPNAASTSNCFGYSPYTLSNYIEWLRPIIKSSAPRKQVIVSITGTLEETAILLDMLQAFANEMGVVLAAEFNASCPNIAGHPPMAYVETELQKYLELLSKHASSNLKVGIKLPPYTYEQQFLAVVRALASVALPDDEHPISFLTCTNTLGQGLVFGDQVVEVKDEIAQKRKAGSTFALPAELGGLAGAAIHQLSLGNVYRLSTLLKADPRLSNISIIAVGGVADAAGVERMRLAGASAVACASALGREGVKVFEKLAPTPFKGLAGSSGVIESAVTARL